MNGFKKILDKFKIDMGMVVAIIVTLAILFTSGVAMGACFVAEGVAAIGAYNGGSSGGGSSGGGGSGGSSLGSNNNANKQPANSNSQPGTKTGIVLPCATPAGSYLSAVNENTKDISSDTEIKSGAAVLVDTTGNVVVASKNADTKIYPASMTKVMTLLVACENAKDPNALLTVTKEIVDEYNKPVNKGASVAKTWLEGDQVTVEDALALVIYESDTVACWLLAEYIAGGESQFVQMMNSKASSMGLTKTNFINCTGLFGENHYTTCREMAAIMAAAMSNESAKTVLTSKSLYTVDIYNNAVKASDISMWSAWYTGRLESNKLNGVAPHYVGGGSDIMIVAGKTGYETIPTNCFVTAGENDITGRKYVCVQVGRTDEISEKISTNQSTNDTRNIYRKYALE